MEEYKINDLVEYNNPKCPVIECWVTDVNTTKSGDIRLNLIARELGYNIMNVPLEYVTKKENICE